MFRTSFSSKEIKTFLIEENLRYKAYINVSKMIQVLYMIEENQSKSETYLDLKVLKNNPYIRPYIGQI